MSNSKTKVFSEIELGEFERRLLAAHTLPRGEDALSELTRLVGTIAADRAAGAKIVDLASRNARPERPASAPERAPEPMVAAKLEPLFAPKPEPAFAPKREPAFELKAEPPLAALSEPEISVNAEPVPVVAIEPSSVAAAKAAPEPSPRLEKLRARFAGFGTNRDREAEPDAGRQQAPTQVLITPPLRSAVVRGSLEDDEVLGDFVAPPAAARIGRSDRGARAKSWYLKVGGLTALGVLMAAGAIAMKLGTTGTHQPPPLILAADSPSKIAPPTATAVQSPGDSGSLLLKDSATPTPAKIVNNEEVPVDLSAISRETQAATSAPAPQPSASATADAAAATPVPPTADTPVVAPSESLGGAPPVAPPAFPAAKRVKTVSVRPDGTLISVDSEPAAAPIQSAPPAAPAAPAPANVSSTSAPMAQTPTLDVPEKPAAKSAARVTASKTPTTVLPPDDDFNPPKAEAPAAPEKPAKLPTKLRPPKPAAAAADAPAPVVASNATPAAEGGGGGNWAVQFAAPRSEAEAQADVSRIKNKYADNLGGTALGVHKVEVNGETVYRVRAGGLSKADAAALCAKLKSSGGDCFVARN